jgi:ATP:ADP antiporter, AAA family
MTAEFGSWRSFFWPIHRMELKKFIPLFLIFFFVTLNYNLLRVFKDSLLVTARGSGAEALPFVKVWAVLPMAILFTMLFSWLSHRLNREKVFMIMISIFLSFFLLFTFVLYPLRDSLHPHQLADQLQSILPAGFKGLIVLLRNWTFTLAYVMSDLWSSVILTVLFWGFTNEITRVHEAKRFYGILTIGANFSAVFSGQVSVFFSKNSFLSWVPYGKDAWDQSVLLLNSTVVFCGIITLILFHFLNKTVICKEFPRQMTQEDLEKPRYSFREHLGTLIRSRYLLCIAFIVLTYNLAMNLIEVVWKNQMKQLYPDPNAYNAYMGEVLTITGMLAGTVSLLLTSNIIRRCSWTCSALIPPVITLVTGFLFFFFGLFPNSMGVWGVAPLFLSVTFGSLQNIFSRASKYTLYDATKELSFVPLDDETKRRGKAAIDGIGSRLGKSGGAMIHQSFILLFGSVAASMPYIATLFLIAVGIWILSVQALGKKFDRLAQPSTV